jgi:dipeptidyl aminopeptidase/acylaminoacyl peptidase
LSIRWLLVVLIAGLRAGELAAQRPVGVEDLTRLKLVSDPQVSPDGEWVAYTVQSADPAKDTLQSDVWMTRWDGSQHVRLTASSEDEGTPRWSPNGTRLGFISSRESARGTDQLWVIDRAGGEARRVTDFAGDVSDFAWAPDGRRVAVIANTPDPADSAAAADSTERPRPVVVDRFMFKEDETGYFDRSHDHLYLLDLDSGKATLLTPGNYDEVAPSWSPDGRSVAFVSRRRPDFDRTNNYDIYVVQAVPGAEPRQLTTYQGADNLPEWGTRAPTWSPDGRYIAYVQGGKPELIYYAVQQLAVVPVAGGPARVLTPTLDRNVLSPVWSPDGSALFFLVEDDRVYHLARIPAAGGAIERIVTGKRAISDISASPQGRIAVTVSTTAQPDEIFAVEGADLRKLSNQNDAWLAEVRLAPVEEISVRSKDGTEIHGFMVKPADYQPGRRYPTILRIHGGPVWQYYHDFANLDWQIFAANGYVVLGMNPRGSSGRGEKFATGIWAAWGEKDGEDVLAAVDWAVKQGVADPGRLGVGGWSYGGMLTNQLIARDRRFKAATSGAGQGNTLSGYGTDQYVIEYEAELGKPWANLKSWEKVSYPFLNAQRIVTPTLFLCGEEDWNLPVLNSEQMYQALKSNGRETQLIVYPGESHDIQRLTFVKDRMTRYLDWYGKYLGGGAGAAAAQR